MFIWHKYAWIKYLDKKEIIELSEKINNSQKLPFRFYEIYDKLYPNQRHVKFTKTYFYGGFAYLIYSPLPEKFISPTEYLGKRTYMINSKKVRVGNKSTLPIYFSFALDRYTTPEKCFDYYVNNFDFLYNSIGLEKASLTYFNKNTNNLTDLEIIGLIVLLENSALYNPRRRPDRFNHRRSELLHKL